MHGTSMAVKDQVDISSNNYQEVPKLSNNTDFQVYNPSSM